MPPVDTSGQICPRYIEGKCPLPEHECIFSHNKKDAPLCIQWVDGACPGGNSCFKRHFYSEKDTNSSKSAQDVNRNSSPVFTSPLVVKVKTLTQSQRRVEVDLDSGRRRSWVEQRNLELVDLTGQSSPALSKLLSRARVEKAEDSKNEKAISKNSPPSALSNDDDGNEAERREDRLGRKPRLEGRLDLVNCSNGKNNGKENSYSHKSSNLEKSSGSRYRDREIRYGHKYSDRDNYGSKNGDRENRYSRKYSDREDSYGRKKSDRESRYSRKYSDREDSYGRKNSDRENRYNRKDYDRDKSYGRNHYRHSGPSQKPTSHNRYSSRSRTPRGRTPHAPRRSKSRSTRRRRSRSRSTSRYSSRSRTPRGRTPHAPRRSRSRSTRRRRSRSRSTRRRRSRSPSRGKIRSNRPLRSRSMWRKRSRSPMRQRKGSQRRSISPRRSRSPRREKQRSTRDFRSRSPKKPRFH